MTLKKGISILAIFVFLGIVTTISVTADDAVQFIPDGLVSQLLFDSPKTGSSSASSPAPDPDLEAGFPAQAWFDAGRYMGGPAMNTRIGNIDADPELEILVSGVSRGPLYAYNHDGSLEPGWPFVHYDRTHYTSLGNLSTEFPGLEVFTGQFIYRVPETPPGPIMAVSGDGKLMTGWPKDSVIDIWGPPLLADVDGDGLDEIFINEGDFQIHAYEADGTGLPGWPVSSSDPSYAAADLDHDGDLEIVTLTDWNSEGADLVAYHHDGRPVDGFSVHFDTYRHVFPVIGDVDADGDNEIIVFSYIDYDPYFSIYVIGPTGVLERIIPIYDLNIVGEPAWTPVLGDLDGDDIPEIIVGGSSGIIVYEDDGSTLEGFPVQFGNPYTFDIINSAPVIGDVDGDGYQDIVMTPVKAHSTQDGYVYVYNSKGQLNDHFPKSIPIGYGSVPAIADIDLDGRNEIIVSGTYWNGRAEFFDKVWVYDLKGTKYGPVEWGQQGGGPQNWGLYPAPPLYTGTDLYISMSSVINAEPDQEVDFLVDYGNLGVSMASSVTLTATLGTGIEYISDTSGITPTIQGQVLVWKLPDLGFRFRRQYEITVHIPLDTVYGEQFINSYAISSGQPDAVPSNNQAVQNIVIARQTFLSIIHR